MRGDERMKLRWKCCMLGPAMIVAFTCVWAAAQTARLQPKREVTPIGCFTNVRSNGEHADGYLVQLWLIQGKIIGMIDYHRGLAGDPPVGVLTEMEHDPKSGKLSFSAKLTAGLHSCRNHKNTPSRDLLTFEGFLREDRLEGDILVVEQSDSPLAVVNERKKFVLRKDDACHLEDFEYYEVWRWYYEPVFQTRGPKW